MVVISRARLRNEGEGAATFATAALSEPQGRYHTIRRRRTNPASLSDAPEGFSRCSFCGSLMPVAEMLKPIAKCPLGHELDLEEAERQNLLKKGSSSNIPGLTRTKMGQISEQVFRELVVDLGPYGVVSEETWSDHYNSPLDGVTSLGWGFDLKSGNWFNRTQAYVLGKKEDSDRKYAAVMASGLRGLIGPYMRMNFGTSQAEVYIEDLRGRRYYEVGRMRPFVVVDFTEFNPFVPKKEKKDDIPF
ncbi:hypothetical protein EPO04_03065 [Patescibacteria group bacterium]|nr:MAG: hypothetical protein EPO04_03065 [Patescibacteria group bacterium]